MNNEKIFNKSIVAGILICASTIVSLNCKNKILGALLFSIGLISVLFTDSWLYTGKVCYTDFKNFKSIENLGDCFVGNMLGVFLLGIWVDYEKAAQIVQTKISQPTGIVFFKSILCGMMIFLAVEGYKKTNSVIPVILGVMCFILGGFEHSIADMSYIVLSGSANIKSILFLLVVTIGNAVGGVVIPHILKE